MTIHELSRRTGFSLRNLRTLEKLGVLKIDAEDEAAPAIRFHLGRNQMLTVGQILALLDAPALLGELGRYEARARAQLDALGDVKATAAPRHVSAYIEDAARGDKDAVDVIAGWARGILPAGDVPHAWLAVRLLLPLGTGLRESAAKSMSLALINARKLMAGFFHKEGKSTIYHQYRGTGLDL